MYAPLGALSAGGTGFLQGMRDADDDQARQLKLEQAKLEMQGIEALGRAFQMPQSPQPPMPGQPSMPPQGGPMPPQAGPGPAPPQALPPGQGGMFGGMPGWAPGERPMGFPAPTQAGPQGPQPPPGSSPGGGAPPAAPPGPSAAAGGMPQLDLQTLVQRIQQANPNLPPKAMMAALNNALPLLNAQGKMELAKLQAEHRGDILDLKTRALDIRERQAQGVGGQMTPDAVESAAERYIKTGQMPPNLGRGTQGRADMAAIQNRAAELAKEKNIKPADLAKNWQTFKAEQTAITRFMSGKQGDTIRSLGVVVDHLGTMRELTDALKNNDLVVFNRLAQAWATQTGNAAPTNVATAAQIVGAEIIKSLGVAGAGTQAERAEVARAFSTAKSPEQLAGAIEVAQKLLGGQLKGLKRQFVSSTGLKADRFDELVGPEAMKFLGGGQAEKPAGGDGGWSIREVK